MTVRQENKVSHMYETPSIRETNIDHETACCNTVTLTIYDPLTGEPVVQMGCGLS